MTGGVVRSVTSDVPWTVPFDSQSWFWLFAPVAVKYSVPSTSVRLAGAAPTEPELSVVSWIVPALVPLVTQSCLSFASLTTALKKRFVPTTVAFSISGWLMVAEKEYTVCGTVSRL